MHHLHFQPTFEGPMIYNNWYIDIADSDLCVWNLLDFKLVRLYPKVSDAYYYKLRSLSDNRILLAQNQIIKIIDLKTGKFLCEAKTTQFIQEIQTYQTLGIVACLMTSKDGFSKIIYKYKLNAKGQLVKEGQIKIKYPKCFQPESRFYIRIFSNSHIYMYEAGSKSIFQLDVKANFKHEHTLNKAPDVFLMMSDCNNLVLAQHSSIIVACVTTSETVAHLYCESQIYDLIEQEPNKSIISAGNQGVKLWNLTNSSLPLLYANSTTVTINKLFIKDDKLIGLAYKTKSILVWNLETRQLLVVKNIKREELLRVVNIDNTKIGLLMKVFKQTEDSLTFYHKLEIVDINTDKTISKTIVKKVGYFVEPTSLIGFDSKILFVCYSNQNSKRYLCHWRQQQNIVKYKIPHQGTIKLYPFDRVLLLDEIQKNTQQTYHIFENKQTSANVSVFTHTFKKLLEIQLETQFCDIVFSDEHTLYVCFDEKISVYRINHNTYYKTNEIECRLGSLGFTSKYIYANDASGNCILYTLDFQLLMKNKFEKSLIKKVIAVSETIIIFVLEEFIELWNLVSQNIIRKKLALQIVDIVNLQQNIYLTKPNRVDVVSINSFFKSAQSRRQFVFMQ